MNKNLPNFLIVGAAKSGTTSLYYYLNQHPEICMPRKETCYFDRDSKTKADKNFTVYTRKDYEALFSQCNSDKVKARGEATPSYLPSYAESVKRILEEAGDICIIIILRNPIDRAYSHYTFYARGEREDRSFEEAVNAEINGDRNPHYLGDYVSQGLYYKQVKAFMDNFSQVKILLTDELKKEPGRLCRELFEFLEVDSDFQPDIKTEMNRSGKPKSRLLQRFLDFALLKPSKLKKILLPILRPFEKGIFRILNKMQNRNIQQRPSMSPDTRQILRDFYREDIKLLSELIDRDLSHWE